MMKKSKIFSIYIKHQYVENSSLKYSNNVFLDENLNELVSSYLEEEN